MRLAILTTLLLAACSGDDGGDDTPNPGDDSGDDGGDDGGDTSVCTALYGDGVCQLSLACGIPDIDCFATYTTDAEARSWYLNEYFDSFQYDPTYGGAPLDESDPRVQRARMLTDRVWDSYPDAIKLGDLANKRVAVIVLDNYNVNAFALANLSGKSSLSVQFLAGILDSDMSDEAIEGVIAHELGHVIGLHALEDVYYSIQKYYVAGDSEQIGATQTNNAAIQAQADEWSYPAYDAGFDRQAALGTIPLGGIGGYYLTSLVDKAMSDNLCYSQASTLSSALSAAQQERALDDGYVMTSTAGTSFLSAYAAFKSCFQSQSSSWSSFATYVTNLGYDPSTFLRPEESNLMSSNALTALETVVSNRRTEMQGIEQSFQNQNDAFWSHLRWYSSEEQADDFAVDYSREAELSEPGVALAAGSFLKERLTECEQARANNTVPYGKYLYDAHHGWCWRRDHAFRYEDYAASRTKKRTMPAWREPFVPTRPVSQKPIF